MLVHCQHRNDDLRRVRCAHVLGGGKQHVRTAHPAQTPHFCLDRPLAPSLKRLPYDNRAAERHAEERARLVSLGKPFDLMVYPNRTHSISEGEGTTLHVYSLIARYLVEHAK